MRRWAWALLALQAAACAHEPPRVALGPPPALPDQKPKVRKKLPADWYWEGVDPEVGSAKKIELPARDVARIEGAARAWDALDAEGQRKLLEDGLVVLDARDLASAKMGAFYTELREQRVPYVVTMDALFFAVHAAFDRALSEVEDVAVEPALDALLVALGKSLAAAESGVDTEVARGLRLARGIVAVAAALDGLASAPDLAAVVAQEVALIDLHAGPQVSPLMGVTIDYARFVPPAHAAHPGAFKSLTWLASAPLALVGRSESRASRVDVATARTHARAALLLARLVDHDSDPKTRDPYARVAKLLAFVWGPPDDLSPGEYADAAEAAGVNASSGEHVSSVTKIDRVRRRAAALRAPRVNDGSGQAPNVRLFGGHAPPDSVRLQALAAEGLPKTAELGAWLAGPDRPKADTLHASVHGSLLDAISEWAASPAPSTAQEGARVESALAAWTWLRHDGRPMSRPKIGKSAAKELRVPGGALAAFVDPEPVVIARLLASVRQMERGLAALGPLKSGSVALTTLAEVEDILAGALRVAVREVNDEPLSPEDVAALASMPARLASLEEELVVPVAADVATDLRTGRALTSATGLVERALVIVREPGTGRLVLAAGAHVAHHEIREPIHERTTDASLRARLDAGLPRAPYVTAFRRPPKSP